jgi:hypothetical protein
MVKKLGTGALLAAALILAVPVIAEARPGGGHGGGHGAKHGGGYRGGHGHSHGHRHGYYRPYYGYGAAALFVGAAYYAYPRYYPAPVYYEPAPAPVYVEQPQVAPQTPAYWYYCQSAQGYYPQVQNCPDGWQRVAPQAPPR